MMNKEYCYVAKCLDMGCPRVWASTREDVEKAMEEWTAKQVRFKPLGLYKYPLIHKEGNTYEINWGEIDSEGKWKDNGVGAI